MTYKDLFSCEGKIAVVTGGAGLVGRGVVKGFHDFGARAYIADTDRERAEGLIEGAEIRYVYLDITSDEKDMDPCITLEDGIAALRLLEDGNV